MSHNTPRHFIDIADLERTDLEEILAMAVEARQDLNNELGQAPQILKSKSVAFISSKQSLRTTGAISMAAARLGGGSTYFGGESMSDEKGNSREPFADMVRCLEEQGYPIIFARLGAHRGIMEMVEAAEKASIVNALTDDSHPTQAVADIEALRLAKPEPQKFKIVFSGDGNNVAVSLAEASVLLGYDFVHTGPNADKYKIDPARWGRIQRIAHASGCTAKHEVNPYEAVSDADMVYADVWASMGQKGEAETRRTDLAGWKVTEALMDRAGDQALFGHCLPAIRGQEVEAAVMDSDRSIAFQIAGCRMDAMVAIMRHLRKQD